MAYQKDWRDELAPGAANPAADGKQNTSGIIDGQTTPNSPASGAASAPAPAPSQQGTGSGFVNLQAYMDNNKGEGGRMVNDATSGLVSDADKFKDTAATTVIDQNKAMQAATGSDKLPGLKNSLYGGALGTGGARDFVNSTAYTGPTAAQADAGLASQQQDLAGKLGAVSGDTAIDALKNKSTTPYSSGFGYLDKFLTGDATGKAAIDAVHAKAAGVNATGDAAKAQLGANETAARNQLATNQSAIKKAAADRIADWERGGNANAANLNKSLNRTDYDGVVNHTMAGGLKPEDQQTLEALAAITGSGSNAAWYNDPGTQGIHKAPPPPPPPPAMNGGVAPGQTSGQQQILNGLGASKSVDNFHNLVNKPSMSTLIPVSEDVVDPFHVRDNTNIPNYIKSIPTPTIPTSVPSAPVIKAPSLKKKPW